MKILLNKKTYFILAFSAMFLPYSVFASSVYINTSHQDFFAEDTVMFSVRVDSENKVINAVEGSVSLDYPTESASLVDINTSDSKFPIWVSKPLPSVDNTNISFAGGSPGGLNSKDAVIFNIVLKLQKEGQINLTPNDFSAYLNDGKGTKDEVSVKSLVINVLPKKSDSRPRNDWDNVTSNDNTPPEPFEIYLGQDESVFEGKKFLSFNAEDKQSGIDYYVVTEGALFPVRSNGTYLLQEQNKSVRVTVVAYDSAGNARESIYGRAPHNVSYLLIVVIIFVLMILSFVIYRKRKKNARIKE